MLLIAMNYPDFVNPEKTMDYEAGFTEPSIRSQYEVYAYMALNICETIVDRKDSRLMETWLPVLRTECALHRNWLEKPANRSKFKPGFHDFAAKILESGEPVCNEAALPGFVED